MLQNEVITRESLLAWDEVELCAQASGLPASRVRELAQFARERDQSLAALLVERGGVDEPTFLAHLAKALSLPFVDDDEQAIKVDVLMKVSPAVAIRYHVVPLSDDNGHLQLACCDPLDWRIWDDLSQVLECPLDRVVCPKAVISRLLKTNYGLGADTVDRMLAGRKDEAIRVGANASDLSSEETAANEPTVVNLINQIIGDAIRANATDIHFEPYEDRYRVRYRIDGMLEDVSLPSSMGLLRNAIVSRVKIMSRLDITEKRLPQDGRGQVKLGQEEFDLRVSVLPGVHGEAINIRLQRRQMVKLELDSLGFERQEIARIEQLTARPHGLILVTGPTGSGKTTTLYTCLNRISKADIKIVTIEDPVEYWMENVLQMQVHEEIGFTFGRALRGMLRHDPDVMLIGEIRDRETADIAIRSSLTGHLVFATLHTNDAASAFTRLLDIGVEPFLVASSVLGVVAQRLVRRVCPACKKAIPISAVDEVYRPQLLASGISADGFIYEGERCEQCRFTGYRGRRVIAEILLTTPGIRQLVQQRESADRIRGLACHEGMRTLRECGMACVRQGSTTPVEVLRVTQEDF